MMQGIAFDCGTSAVRAALFSYSQKDTPIKPRVSEVIRIPFTPGAYMDAHQLKQKTQASIQHILKKIPSSFQPRHVVLGLSSPFYVSKTLQTMRKRPQPSDLITKEEFQDFTIETERTFEEDAKKRITDGDINIFTALPQRTYINGYRVENPIDATGKTIEISFYFEATTRETLATIKEIITHRYTHATFHVSSIALANFQALRGIYGNELGFLVIDIGGEITEITLSTEGILEQVTSLPIGHMLILREIAALFDISLTDASFILNRYAEHTLESKKETTIKPLMLEFADMWRKKLLTILTAFTERYDMPPRIFFTGTGVLPFHKEICAEEIFRSVFYAKNVLVETAHPDILSPRFTAHPFRSTTDFGLASLALLGTEIKV